MQLVCLFDADVGELSNGLSLDRGIDADCLLQLELGSYIGLIEKLKN